MSAASLPIPACIDVPLREKRSYIHSTNLFDFLVSATGANCNLALSFRRKIECEIYARRADEVNDIESFPARFIGESERGRIDIVLAEKQPIMPIRDREPYNEAAVIEGCRIEGLAIQSDRSNGASAMERIVALNKVLIAQTAAPEKVLVFSRIDLTSLPSAEAALIVRLKSRLGQRMFRSTILADAAEIGEIVFYGT